MKKRLNAAEQRDVAKCRDEFNPLKNVDTILLNGEHESSVLDGIQ